MTSSLGLGSDREAFSFSLRRTFSTSTIASSTTIPMATARPPRVIEFTLISIRVKMRTVAVKESGMAVRVMRVVINEVNIFLRLNKKMNSTATTIRAPSRIASMRLLIAESIKLACLKSGVSWMSFPSAASCLVVLTRVASISAVSLLVSTPGDFTTLRITPGAPLTPASPRCGWMPQVTSATSPRVMVRSPIFLTMVCLISSRSVVMARMRIICSWERLVE